MVTHRLLRDFCSADTVRRWAGAVQRWYPGWAERWPGERRRFPTGRRAECCWAGSWRRIRPWARESGQHWAETRRHCRHFDFAAREAGLAAVAGDAVVEVLGTGRRAGCCRAAARLRSRRNCYRNCYQSWTDGIPLQTDEINLPYLPK